MCFKASTSVKQTKQAIAWTQEQKTGKVVNDATYLGNETQWEGRTKIDMDYRKTQMHEGYHASKKLWITKL